MAIPNRDINDYERIVVEHLLSCGYPKVSIVLEGKLDERCFADIVVNDTSTGLPMMMIEIKSCSHRTRDGVRRMAYESLRRWYAISPIKAVAAILDRDQGELELVDYTEAIKENDFKCATENYKLPPYEILIIGARQKAIDKQKKDKEQKIVAIKKEQEQKITALKILCWIILPIACIILVVLDAVGIYPFSALRLIAIGAVAGVTVLPCFKEIKIGEISLKNEIEQEKKEVE